MVFWQFLKRDVLEFAQEGSLIRQLGLSSACIAGELAFPGHVYRHVAEGGEVSTAVRQVSFELFDDFLEVGLLCVLLPTCFCQLGLQLGDLPLVELEVDLVFSLHLSHQSLEPCYLVGLSCFGWGSWSGSD